MTLRNNDPLEFVFRVCPLLVIVCSVVSYCIAGLSGGIAAVIGGVMSWGALWMSARTVRNAVHEGTVKIIAQGRLQLAFLAKLPAFVAIVFLVTKLGMAPAACFVAGYLLVYFALLVGAVIRPRSL